MEWKQQHVFPGRKRTAAHSADINMISYQISETIFLYHVNNCSLLIIERLGKV